ncbi:hypothetical protein HBI56_115520 [Parastagonospora nodorum]|uniref:Uncharacterized protein n=1 Tax=Phaeosphaeria nodorum (strain SN15 / ATCC MYA-4574 / FGSC 10173) TaxID=321614 RepID=A0A7U2F8A6_PHANO|nr:hypothetical protein HBH56_196380 [Parastagonospora nodorum]QRD00608.1 hypothetical protein JI435_415420 [Parastagonospora nodorum SN15]KAH3924861.1 hypothetical protein HBH54_187110 [Parastagonospora nodorum]KAH3953223.1 hypothetical protein HBH53_039250 [Parastagonospora nodorum]KAH3976189.1 hypothetical protein HBH52_119230 [Parastagonospora nodorum]
MQRIHISKYFGVDASWADRNVFMTTRLGSWKTLFMAPKTCPRFAGVGLVCSSSYALRQLEWSLIMGSTRHRSILRGTGQRQLGKADAPWLSAMFASSSS